MYQWFVFIHLVGLVLFAFAHGASAFVAFRLPGQRDRALVASYLETSLLATRTMYIGLVLLLIGAPAPPRSTTSGRSPGSWGRSWCWSWSSG